MSARAQEVADALLGTAESLEKYATQEEREDRAFLERLDELVTECTQCGWWVETHEIDDDGVCAECRDE